MLKRVFVLSLLLVLAMTAIGVFAYEGDKGEVIVADKLNGPRNLFRDTDGTLYIAETGTGGETTGEVELLGTANMGATGQITMVKDGAQSVFLGGLFSAISESGEQLGPHAVLLTDDTIWVVVGQGIADSTPPSYALIAFDRATQEQKQVVNFLDYEQANNPDQGAIDSNPVDILAASDGTVYVADAGANAVLKVAADGTISTFAAWPQAEGKAQPVPTALAEDADGNIYVGFLTGYPFLPGDAWIEKLDATGASLEQYTGLTLVTDIQFGSDGALYASEYASGFGDLGFIADSGQIVKVTDAGAEPVVTGLNFPFGILEDTEAGGWLVSVCTSFVGPDLGQVILVKAGMDFSEAPAPGSTEEAAAPGTTEEAPAPIETEQAEG